MDTLNQSQPVALITGASRGIGLAIARKLAANNFKLALMARSKEALEQAAHELINEYSIPQDNILVLDTDITDSQRVESKITECYKHFNSIDTAVINHGMYKKTFFLGKPEQWRDVMNVNLISVMHITEKLLPYLTASECKNKSLLYTASVASHVRYGGGAAYCASKHGLLGFAHCIFEEVRETGLKVSAICPGFVNTDMVNAAAIDTSKAIQPEDIADTIFNILSLESTICPVEIIVRPQYSPYN